MKTVTDFKKVQAVVEKPSNAFLGFCASGNIPEIAEFTVVAGNKHDVVLLFNALINSAGAGPGYCDASGIQEIAIFEKNAITESASASDPQHCAYCGCPASVQTAEQTLRDKTILDWLTEQCVDTIHLDDGRIIDVGGSERPHDVRRAIAVAMHNAEVSR